jgi:hypothetical protein
MPPTFVYMLALAVYMAFAFLVWIFALVLAIPRRTRRLAKKIAAGMAGSFPGVFLFQLCSAPFILLFLLIIGGLSHLFRPPDPVLILLALFVFLIPFVASLLGFYTGWRVAWELAAGRSAGELLQTDRLLAPLARFLWKRLPLKKGFLI